jgi:hypothetical protein
MSWALYPHLPAQGLGHRDPRRPHVTGGVGAGVVVLVDQEGRYWTLFTIVDEIKSTKDDVRVACPVCGEILVENADGVKNCILGHWQSDERAPILAQ